MTTLRSYALKAQPKSEMSTRGEPAQHPVDEAGRQRAAPGVVARRAAAACHVIARSDGLDELGDVLRLVLEVPVHRHDHLAARTHETRVHRGMLTVVALEANGAHAGIARVQALEHGEGSVRRAVVDEHELERAADRVERLRRAAVQLVQRPRLVEERDDDRDLGRGVELGVASGPR